MQHMIFIECPKDIVFRCVNGIMYPLNYAGWPFAEAGSKVELYVEPIDGDYEFNVLVFDGLFPNPIAVRYPRPDEVNRISFIMPDDSVIVHAERYTHYCDEMESIDEYMPLIIRSSEYLSDVEVFEGAKWFDTNKSVYYCKPGELIRLRAMNVYNMPAEQFFVSSRIYEMRRDAAVPFNKRIDGPYIYIDFVMPDSKTNVRLFTPYYVKEMIYRMSNNNKHIIRVVERGDLTIKVTGRILGMDRYDNLETIEGATVSFEVTSDKYDCRDIGVRVISHADRKPNGPDVVIINDESDVDHFKGQFIMPDSVVSIEGQPIENARLKDDKKEDVKMGHTLNVKRTGAESDMQLAISISKDGNNITDLGFVPEGSLVHIDVEMDNQKNTTINVRSTGGEYIHTNFTDLPPASRMSGNPRRRKESFSFVMPDDDVNVSIDTITGNSDAQYIDPKTLFAPEMFNIGRTTTDSAPAVTKSSNGIIDYFTIPDALARELSDLLTKQVIKERLLIQLIDDQDRYDKIEASLVPIVTKVEAIKLKITKEYVPAKYNSTRYKWNYDGYEVDGNRVQVIESV